MTPGSILVVLPGCLVLALALATLRAARRRRNARAGYFDAVALLFDRVVTRVEPTGFPRMTGHLGPHAFDLQAIPDSLTFRKLPALWVLVSLPRPVPVGGTLDIMARPTGQEPFSHFANLPVSLPCPAVLPPGTSLRCDQPEGLPPERLIARHADAFADARVKEMLISPRGLRLVLLGEEADRGRFLIFRDAETGMTPLPADRLRPVLERLIALGDDLAAEAANRKSA